jgi:hypothetical protein
MQGAAGYCVRENHALDAWMGFDIKSEKERKLSQHRGEFGVRIQNFGFYSDPTGDTGVLDAMLEGAFNGANSADEVPLDPDLQKKSQLDP